MKIKNNISETGIAEVLSVLYKFSHCENIIQNESLYIPFPNEDPEPQIEAIAKNLALLNKSKLLLFTPEIAVIEKIIKYNAAKEIIVCLPYNTYTDSLEPIAANMPDGITITFIHENEIPSQFNYSNAAIVAFGFRRGNRSLILSSTYRMIKKYDTFYGSKIIASLGDAAGDVRPVGWMAVNTHEFFNTSI